MRKDTVLHSIRDFAQSQPDKYAVCELRKTLTYSEYWSQIKKTATVLMDMGIKKGDYVVILCTQNIPFLVTFTALQYLGAIPFPIEKSSSEEHMKQVYAFAQATYYIGNQVVEGLNTIVYKEITPKVDEAEEAEMELPGAQSRSMILYTTGTTGASKGVVVKHINDVTIAENIIEGTHMKKENVEIIPMPLNHAFAMRRYESNMVNGSTVCLMDGVVFIGVLWKMLDKYHATAMAIAPAALSVIFNLSEDRIGEYKDQMDYIQIGSAPLVEADKEHILRLMPDVRLYNFYGSSEAGCSCILNFNSSDNKPGCIGKPTVNSWVRFNDEDGNIVKEPTIENPALLSWGGPIVMEGYYRDPETTQENMDDGYVKTKDLAYLDEEGRVILVGRADDIINFGGSKISPAEVEDCAMGYEGIVECAYTSRPDPITGEAPIMLVVKKDNYDEKELSQFLAQRLEGYKLPKNIYEVESLPRTFKGTLLRKEVKKIVESIINQ